MLKKLSASDRSKSMTILNIPIVLREGGKEKEHPMYKIFRR